MPLFVLTGPLHSLVSPFPLDPLRLLVVSFVAGLSCAARQFSLSGRVRQSCGKVWWLGKLEPHWGTLFLMVVPYNWIPPRVVQNVVLGCTFKTLVLVCCILGSPCIPGLDR